MRLFLIFGIICLCVIVAYFAVFDTIGFPKSMKPTPQDSSVATKGVLVKKNPCSCCPTREERVRRGKILREKMEQAWAEIEKQKSTHTPTK